MHQAIKKLITSVPFRSFIIVVILLNATVHGIQTNQNLSSELNQKLIFVDIACLWIFIFEILLKLYVYKHKFFKGGWNVFDFFIVGISLVPEFASFSVMRTFRVFRVFRLLSNIPSLGRVATALVQAIPSVLSTIILISVLFYVFAVMAVNLFVKTNPEIFGDLGSSLFVLFQIMTLDDWSNEVARPVMEHHPHSWIFFVSFILLASFTALNLFVGIIVDAIHSTSMSIELSRKKKKLKNIKNDEQEIYKELSLKLVDIKELHQRQNMQIQELKDLIEITKQNNNS